MIQMTALRNSVGAMIATLLLVAAGTNAVAAGLSGAIFTTDVTGLFVNGNVYGDDDDVYLNGGPKPNAPCTAAGLPIGNYYFQVTDPSGKVLLSTDDVTAREVVVNNGVIVGPASPFSNHFFRAGQCSSQTVQLCPFDPSPNAGEEYKVWMTKVDDYNNAGGFFVPSKSKTDNFKVTAYTQGCEPPPSGPDD
jgi:hypothetical protein